MKRQLLIITFLLSLFSGGMLKAQTGLQIEKIFETYGKQKGAVLIELSTDVLASRTQMKLYKSLTLASDDPLIAAVETAIENDITGGYKLIETQKNGQTETGYYCLKKKEYSQMYEYILYKEKSKKVTLIYIRGTFPPQKLESELSKLKDLFIYVNNKRIKLQ